MRRLMWFTLGFALSCGLGAWSIPVPVWVPLLLCVLLLGLSRKWEQLKPGILLAVGCAAGLGWFGLYGHFYLAPAVKVDGQVQNAQIQITDYSQESLYGCAATGVVSLDGRSYQVWTYVNDIASLEPGDILTGQFRFRVTTPGGEEEMTIHSGKGIFLVASQRGDLTIGRAEQENWRCYASRLRQKIREILTQCFPEDSLGFVQALLIGDTGKLDYKTDVAFQITGIRHVIAVSGLHVSILFTLLGMVTFKRRFLMALVGFPALLVFAAAAGFTPSVTRACIMSGLMLLSLLLEKEYDGPTALSFAALGMLILNPLAITSVSFQMSAASVAGIFLFYEPVRAWMLGKLPKRKETAGRVFSSLTATVSMTLSATALTVPLTAYYFGTVSLIGMATNLLVLWVVTPVFFGILAVCGLQFLWQGGAVVLAKLVSVPVRYILWLTKLLAKFPLAAVYTSSIFIVIWLAASYVLIALFLLRKKRSVTVLVSQIVVGLCVAVLLSWKVPGEETRITMLDVGQGQSILLQSEGCSWLVDCGGNSDKVAADTAAKQLLGQGIDTLEGVILTHYDRDHMGGLPYLLQRVDTDVLILPDTEDYGKADEIPQTDRETVYAKDTVTVEYGSTKLTVFGPVYSGYSNENSLCILFETENCAILITGDRSEFGERMLLRRFTLPDVDILVAGHHGSASSTSEELLDAVKPETVLISVEEDNRYNHPAQELLDRLLQRGIEIIRTDEAGNIIIRR